MFRPVTIGIILVITCATKGKEAVSSGNKVCNETVCRELEKKIEEQMGSSKPCSDFHDYVCGNWNGSQEPKSVPLKKKAVEDLIVLLENATTPSPIPVNATDKLILAYRSCTRKSEDTQALKKSIKNVLNGYKLGEWPIRQTGSADVAGDDYVKLLKKIGPRPIFYYSAEVDNDGMPTIVMSTPSDFYVSGVDYADYIDQLQSQTGNNDDETSSPSYYSQEQEEAHYKTFITKAIALVNDSITEQQSSEVADSIIAFEKNLSKLADEAKEEPTKFNLSQLSQMLMDNFPMIDVLKKDLNVINFIISGTTEVNVTHPDYYTKVIKYLKNDADKNALVNYAMWTVVRRMAEAEETPLHEVYLEYKSNTSIYGKQNVSKSNDTKTHCLLQLLQPDVMYSAGASYYSKNKFDSNAKKEVAKIFHFIMKEFIFFVKNNTWMSEDIKKAALERLKTMEVVIGYPDWILQNATINYLYKYASIASDNVSFVEHFHQLKENDHFQKLLILNNCNINKTNDNVTLRSHAYYDEASDTLAYPAASLVTHYRPSPIPRALNFGTIGTIFVQLLSIAVDRFHDRYGKPKGDFWDTNTTENFCKSSMCLNNTEECSDKRDVNNSSYQYFRDYIGVRVSHEAFKSSKENYTGASLLPGEKFNTEDKIFFSAFGSLYCPYSVQNSKKKVQARADIPDDDLPKSLNEVVSKYMDFNTTFSCKGDVKDACHLIPPEWITNTSGC